MGKVKDLLDLWKDKKKTNLNGYVCHTDKLGAKLIRAIIKTPKNMRVDDVGNFLKLVESYEESYNLLTKNPNKEKKCTELKIKIKKKTGLIKTCNQSSEHINKSVVPYSRKLPSTVACNKLLSNGKSSIEYDHIIPVGEILTAVTRCGYIPNKNRKKTKKTLRGVFDTVAVPQEFNSKKRIFDSDLDFSHFGCNENIMPYLEGKVAVLNTSGYKPAEYDAPRVLQSFKEESDHNNDGKVSINELRKTIENH